MKLRTLLTLGRTSNLPTVWSNVLAGAVLSGGEFGLAPLLVLALCGSAFYEGGMFLNDAFDAEIDARERPNRPIPSGQASRRGVAIVGFALLGGGLLLLLLASLAGVTRPSLAAAAAGAATCLAILVYNRWHKGHAWSPLVMGACRAGLYLTAALAVSPSLGPMLLLGAAALWLYVVGLTHVARFESGRPVERAWISLLVLAPLLGAASQMIEQRALLPLLCCALLLGWTVRALDLARRGGPQIPRAVVSLIAGISLVDALFISLFAEPPWVLAALFCFLLTLKGQRRIPGT